MDAYVLPVFTAGLHCGEVQQRQGLLATGRFPRLGRVLTEGYDFDIDALFEFGLQRMLGGLAVLIETYR